MDDMYNNQNNQEDSYQQSQQQSPYGQPQPTVREQLQSSYQRPSIQEQLQYQYGPSQDELEEPITMGEWMISLLIMLIPCANIIMAFVWAFSDKEKKTKSNFFKAYLIYLGISILLSIVMLVIFGAFISTLASSMTYY